MMHKDAQSPIKGLMALPGFPLILVTAGHNVMTAAAFSFYSFEPPSVMVGLRPPTWTYELVAEKAEFGVNLLSRDQVEAARVCGSASGRDVDKFAAAGLTPQQSRVLETVLVAECPVSLECRVVHRVDYGGTHAWFIGEIVAAHVAESFTRDGALTFWPRQYRAIGPVVCEVEG
jgi:flavin reductase (DIM6/NTAB) family NADH-FMN oxidoreductase RutF